MLVTCAGDIPRNAGNGQAAGGRRTLRHCCGRGQAPRPLSSRTGAGNTEAGNPLRGQRSLEAPGVRIKGAQNKDPGLAETASRLRRNSRIDETREMLELQHQQAGQQLHTGDRRGHKVTNQRPAQRSWRQCRHSGPASLQAPGASPISRSLHESHDWPTFYNIQFPLCFSQFLFRGDL